MPLGYLRALGGLAQGQNQREQQDYERKQTETARQDRLQAAAAALMARQAESDYQRTRDAATDQRQGQQDLQKAYADGYVPTEQLHTEGQQAQQAGAAMMAPGAATFDDTGIGTAITAAGTQAAKAPTMLTYANTALSKGRNSATEQARYDNIEARKEDRAAQIAGSKEAAQIAANARAEQDQRNADLRRELQGNQLAASAANRQSAPERPPTQGELAAGGLLPEIRGARDFLNQHDNPSALAVMASKGGMLSNWTNSEDGQAYMQAANQYIQNTIYAKSGKAVTEGEMKRLYDTYIPMPGDKPAVLERKRQARHLNEQGVGIVAGRALNRVDALEAAEPRQPTAPSTPRPAQQFAKPSPQAQSILNNLLKPGGA